ncbi:O-antigen ligase family protein, partial [bacterium]|nr:O-antigen ligase family protein [bacterium]
MMQISKRVIKWGGILLAIIFLAYLSGKNLVFPLGIGALVFALVAIFIYPEFALVSFIYGASFYRAITFVQSGAIILALMFFVAVIGLLGLWFRNKIVPFRVDWFQIALFLIVVWSAMSLLWSYDPHTGLIRWITWMGVGVIPMEFAIIFFAKRDNRKIELFYKIALLGAIIYLIFSAIAFMMWRGNMFTRFGPQGDSLAFARSMGFMLVFLVWILDKVSVRFRPAIAIMIIVVVYFLILSATRAPFAVAIVLSVGYLFLFSRINVNLKILIGVLVVFGVLYFLRGSYLMFRLLSTRHISELSLTIRGMIWRSCYRHILDVPVLYGVGMGGFKVFLPHMLKYIQHAHNNFAAVYTEMGLIGLVLYIITVFVIPIKALRRYISGIKYRYQDADMMLLEFALLMWLYR